MLKFDNTHIFTGYLKQLLSSFNLPTCKIYTKEFADFYAKYGVEDPRVVESFDSLSYVYNNGISKSRAAARVNYLKANELYNYMWEYDQNKPNLNHSNCFWRHTSSIFYNSDIKITGLTKVLNSPGNAYDAATHEHLGEYLRFMRDYYDINLMSMYNCFNNKICNNLYYSFKINVANPSLDINQNEGQTNAKDITTYSRIFDSRDTKYRIYAFPVKLFADYTIAIDCNTEIEMFCGFYKTALDTTNKAKDLIAKTYQKINSTFFSQPFLYSKLNVKNWNFERDTQVTDIDKAYPQFIDSNTVTRWDILDREQDLKLFIKIPASCKSSIVVLEGDFRSFNDFKYFPVCYDENKNIFNPENIGTTKEKVVWEYKQNHFVLNFGHKECLDNGRFVPISKLQLLAINTGESYPFADRLIEYLSNSAITPIDPISDNIKRAQAVMSQNHHHFKIEGLWEDKMQKIIYDYLMNAGPIDVIKNADNKYMLADGRRGYQPTLGYTSKSALYDVLGYVDKDAEKWYTSWTAENGKAVVRDSIQNVDIYVDKNGKNLWDI